MSSLETSPHYIPLPILGQEFVDAPATDFSALRAKLGEKEGRAFWRSLDELTETPEFKDYVEHEFPAGADLWMEPISRRDFLKMMGASIGMALLAGCRKPIEKILPYNQSPEDLVPGKPLFFASSLPFQGYGQGVLVQSHMGRPTKVEGNPDHPDSFGATSIFMQAAVLDLYDPDRSQVILQDKLIHSWDDLVRTIQLIRDNQRGLQGAGLRILTGTVTSPTIAAQLEQFQKMFPKAKWHAYESVNRDNARAGSRQAFGRDLDIIYRLDNADVIAAFDHDLLGPGPGQLNYSRSFAKRRQVEGSNVMNRLYVAEVTPSITGTIADHRLAVRATHIEEALAYVAKQLGLSADTTQTFSDAQQKWLNALVHDLKAARGRGVVSVGDAQPPRAHALAHAINSQLGNLGRTVVAIQPVEARPQLQTESLKELVLDMQQGKVECLLILGGNPVFNAPADLPFKEALSNVPTRIHLGQHLDETAAYCHWHVPEAHPLESWGDLRAFDGTASLVQPLIEPLYSGKTVSEILSVLIDESPSTAHALVQDYWKRRGGSIDFDSAWNKALHGGVIPGTAYSAVSVSARGNFGTSQAGAADQLDVAIRPDPTIWDGRYANNGWLQECPKPVTKMVWDNVALVSPKTAEKLGVHNGQMISLTVQNRTAEAPAWILPGQADQTITVYVGYGRRKIGRVGNNVGFDIQRLRGTETMTAATGVTVKNHHRKYPLASTQHHFAFEGRDLIRTTSLAHFKANPEFAHREHVPTKEESLYTFTLPEQSEDNQWAMTIDLNVCTGCNACLVACQAENNIPVVGKIQVAKGREMHWIRIDSYFSGDLENPDLHTQPVTCMHCENAPCEPVCPVGATVHDQEGLNAMVYNRCIGTRYCSNNCPYKVRRFNFFSYTKDVKGPLELVQNPNVSVRSRGVMEKCTYCVQRISAARIEAKKQARPIADGEVIPACGQGCPTQAITFGNLLDAKSKVAAAKKNPRDYGLLTDMGTRPRTSYLAKIRNPNPELEKDRPAEEPVHHGGGHA